MAIRLCHSCAQEVNEGDKKCRHCQAILDQYQSVIEIESDDGGYSFSTNGNAYEDEALKNFKQGYTDVKFEEIKTKSMNHSTIEKYEHNEEMMEEDFDANRSMENMFLQIKNVMANPMDYLAFFIGFIGCLILMGGVVMPLYMSKDQKSHFIYQEPLNYYGLFVVLLVVVAIFTILKAKQKFSIIPSIFLLTLMIYMLIFFSATDEFKDIGMGYYLICLGSITVITSAVLIGKEDEQGKDGKRGDNRNSPLYKKDFAWVLLTVIISIVTINTLFHNEELSGISTVKVEAGNEAHRVENRPLTVSVGDSLKGMELIITDAYLVKCKKGDSVVVNICLNNYKEKAVSFNDAFDLVVTQKGRGLPINNDVENGFKMKQDDVKVASGNKLSINFGFQVFDNSKIQVYIYEKAGNKKIVSHTMTLNEVYYTSQNIVNSTASPQTDLQQTEDNQTSGTKAPANKTEQVTPTKSVQQTVAPATEKISPTTAPTVAPTVAPTQTTTWCVYFQKPSSWGNDIYIYIYSVDPATGEIDNKGINWPGTKMESAGNGIYKYTYGAEWYEKGLCLFSDGNGNQYPAANEPGCGMKGNISYAP